MPRGGHRPGAGRPKGTAAPREKAIKAPRAAKLAPDITAAAKAARLTPLEYMLQVLNDPEADESRRDRMAQAAAPFVHAKPGAMEGGKKADAQLAAEQAGAGSVWGDDLTYRARN